MIKKLIFLSIIAVIFLSSCNDTSRSEKSGSVVITDMLGRDVSVPENVESIVGVRAGALRLLVYMDATSMIAGIEYPETRSNRPYMKAYPELLGLPTIGPSMGGDAEMILNVEPDVIFKTYTTTQDANKLQRQTGIPVVALECTDLGTDNENIFESLRLIGKIINNKERADSIINYIEENIAELNTLTKDISQDNKPTVYVGGLSYSNSYGIKATHHRFAPFLFVNANNVASEIDERLTSHVKGTFIDIEKLLFWDPEYLFIDESGLNLVNQDLKTKTVLKHSLKAIENSNAFSLLPYNNYATNYEFVLLNSWYIGKQIYPEQFEDICFNEKADELLYHFYGKPVTVKSLGYPRALDNITVEKL